MLTFLDLDAWKESRTLYRAVYKAVEQLPPEEMYGLTSQLKRAAVSISANIAEGQGRGTRKDYIHFLYNARGSAYEVESHLITCADLQFMDRNTLVILYKQTVKVIRLINSLISSLKRKTQSSVQENKYVYRKHEELVTEEDLVEWEMCITGKP